VLVTITQTTVEWFFLTNRRGWVLVTIKMNLMGDEEESIYFSS
jgi:hypothetical protein